MKKIKEIQKVVIIFILVLGLIFLGLSGCGGGKTLSNKSNDQKNDDPGNNKQDKIYVSIATTSIGGTWNTIGAAMASAVSKGNSNMQVTAEVTGGGADNVRQVGLGKIPIGFTTNGLAFAGLKGIGAFEGKEMPKIRAIIAGHPLVLQTYTLQNSGINNYTDFKDKAISVGSPGAAGNIMIENIMSAYSYQINKDWKPVFMQHSESPGAVADGNVAAALITSSVPTPTVTEITSTHDAKLLDINYEEEEIVNLLKKKPYWRKIEIPAGTYKGQDHPIQTLAETTILITNADVSEDVIYNFTKWLLENYNKYKDVHPDAAKWNLENALNGIEGIVPLHPGAERYLKEAGVLK
jgi:TRAP transporter TAXI family solute receptor